MIQSDYRGWFNHQLDEINNLSTDFVKTSCFGFPFVEKKSTQGTQGDQLRALRDLGLCDAQLWKEANLAGNVTPKE